MSAVVVEHGPDAGAVWHYGDPLREQRLLDKGNGHVDQSHRPLVRIAGRDRLSWLHTVTSQHLAELPPGTWTQALVLSPHGHVEHHLTLVDDGAAVWAHIEPGTSAALRQYLQGMRFWSDVDVTDVSDTHAVMWRPGPLGMDGTDTWTLLHRDDLDGWRADAGPPAGLWAYEALRVAAGRPRLGLETDHRTIPHEVGWIGVAVHLDKGCYRGQETVARVHNLGRPPRRLVRLHLDGSSERLPVAGSSVVPDGAAATARPVGFVGTSAQHHELGPVALAVVKRTVGDGDAVAVVASQDALMRASVEPVVQAVP